jgi:ATP-dependent RNA helicase RhlE
MSFESLNLAEPIQRALISEGYTQPTPIQKQAIPILLDHKDLLACAQTGTGKTAAFAIPIIQSLLDNPADPTRSRQIKALILCPTRELAAQIYQNFNSYARFTPVRTAVIFGGVPQGAQETALIKGVDVLIATPGRLLDLMGQGYIHFGNLNWFVLDEADLMLDMGFIPDIKRIIRQLPEHRQSVFLSATMPYEAVKLANMILHKPEKVDVTEQISSADTINQLLYYVSNPDKRALLIHILKRNPSGNALVFTNTKSGADRITRSLNQGGIPAESIHGNKPQFARIKALGDFKSGRSRVLVATDIAARGIDVTDLSMVINYDMPNVPQMYIHRIGRTGRAGAGGNAISFCDAGERDYLRDIQKLLANNIPVVADHPFSKNGNQTHVRSKSVAAPEPPAAKPATRRTITLRTSVSVHEEHSG